MPDDRLIVALDLPDARQGLELADRLGESVSFYKIGLGMLTGGGLALANELKADRGKRIFLDMKLFDIAATVERAVRGLVQFDLDFLTVHGDPHVVQAAKEGCGNSDMKILAVTLLTSLDRYDLDAAMIKPGEIPNLVTERAKRAFEAGADGVIASPKELRSIRKLTKWRNKLVVTPGIRPIDIDPEIQRIAELAGVDDQKRVATPAFAVNNGADHIVVGRPVWAAPDPAAAARAILEEIAAA